MTTSQFLKPASTEGQPVYDRWDRYKIPHPDDPDGPRKPWTRASTVAKAISDQTALNKWFLRKVLEGSQFMDLSQMRPRDWENKSEVDKLAQTALDKSGSRDGAVRGTKFHSLTEKYDRGEDPEPETALEAKMLDGYIEAMAAVGVGAVPAFIEKTVVVPGIDCGGAAVAGIAGTFDRVVQSKRTGKFYVFDVKTTTTLDHSVYSMVEWELQLSAYQQATQFWSWQDNKFYNLPTLEPDRALVFHVERDTGEWAIYPVDLEAGRRSLDLACQVRAWRAGNRGMAISTIATSK